MSQPAAERRSVLAAALGRCLGAALLLWALAVSALPEDRQQSIRITADQALRDEKQGFTEYTGNVRMEQGSLRIEADKITIYHQAEAADRIVAEGSPARMQQQPEPDKGLIHARALVIEYYEAEERVQLNREARIEQEGSIVTGDRIDYLIAEQRVKADSGQNGSGSRVEVVIPARAVEGDDGEPGGTTPSE
ncbi:lipopolysaccharide transport periplasmic protein LptA [Kineobactrum salinum]|uniref:Lipopolysaccharide export system protein LptA n=1 Tax=Kineobactrum salinum TaxID=2708301 RepID=A0A6C0U593_9GAMM|nr:lipopolysaccharide transport periplasmic protein LptA [Kineobactrum salinum]QIB66589.1 lipopolysaccharide transport periplasmic protein LptA [Kineobactrum salinum]